jgi:hypothetical protein
MYCPELKHVTETKRTNEFAGVVARNMAVGLIIPGDAAFPKHNRYTGSS